MRITLILAGHEHRLSFGYLGYFLESKIDLKLPVDDVVAVVVVVVVAAVVVA